MIFIKKKGLLAKTAYKTQYNKHEQYLQPRTKYVHLNLLRHNTGFNEA